jgi:SAGA-associated factor 29
MINFRLKASTESRLSTRNWRPGCMKSKPPLRERLSEPSILTSTPSQYILLIGHRAIEDAIESIDVLIALRSATEAPPQGEYAAPRPQATYLTLASTEKRKRPRAPSPATSAGYSAGTPTGATSRGVSITLPPRNSVGPAPAIPFSREPKARREALAKQLPLQEGRKVAFHAPAGKPGDASATGEEEISWILAVVTKCINQDKNR